MFYFKKSLTAIAVAASMGMAASVYAAGNTDGALTGQVLSTANTPVPNATITIKSVDTGFERTITAGADGSYRFGKLPVGKYSVTVSKAGYETTEVESVLIQIGSSSANIALAETGYETIEVTGASVSMIDVRSSESGLNIGEIELDRIPVPRDVTSVALLAPGTTQGDNRFGNLASFGGASIAENTMYINGLNVTNFRNGVGFSSVPFEFYKEFQIKTGGYSAEFGRSTGGVINAVTKSGTNEFEFGGNIFYRPDSLRKDSPNSFETTGSPYIINDQDYNNEIDGNIFASGPLIKDTLFFYAIYNPKSHKDNDVLSRGSSFREREEEDAFWGVKLDWQITDNHRLEYLTFSDSNDEVDRTFGYDVDTGEKGVLQSTATTKEGGDNYSFKYTGYITDDLTISALYGENKYDITSLADNQDSCNLVYDRRANAPHGLSIGCATVSDYFVELGEDTREAMRLDIEYFIGDHLIRAGFDRETNTSFSQQKYSGAGDGAYWFIYDGVPGTQVVPGVIVPEGVDSYTRERIRTVGGSFETEASAIYIEDVWSVTDTVTLTLGLRQETFDNKNSAGDTFVKIDDMIAPRIGVAWDVEGDGQSKIFANVGRYFLPVPNNTNVRLSGNEYDVYNYYEFEGLQEGDFNGSPYYTPIPGEQFGQQVNATGVVPDTTIIVDQDLDPMYQDEFILGYQRNISDDWTVGIKGIRRLLNGAIDDMLIDHYTEEVYGCGHVDHAYVLGNPGEDMDVNVDTDCDGVGDGVITIPGADLGYPTAERKYSAVEITFARIWDGDWSMNGSYTWSHSYGNTEGLVKSDNGQDDAGITTDFDFVELTDGAYGDLANDRRHMIKLWGSYAMTENLTLSANFSMQSGRPRNAFGVGHPDADGGVGYGQTYYLCAANCNVSGGQDWVFMPRGTYGRTDWVNRLDLAAIYNMDIQGVDVQLRAEIFNVLEGDSVTYYEEDLEETFGELDPIFGAPSQWQTPRHVQFSASVKF